MSALAARVPVLIGSLDPVPERPTFAAAQAFFERSETPYPFRAWPLSLSRLLQPVLHQNPYLDAVCGVPVLDEDAFLASLHDLLGEEGAAAQRLRQQRYVDQVRALPSPSDKFYSLLAAARR